MMRKWGELSKRERKVKIVEGSSKKEYNQEAREYNKEAKKEQKSIDHENKTKNIDVAGNVSGAQILSAYSSAKEIIAVREPDEKKQEEILVKNLVALIVNQSDKIYKSSPDKED
ncbi:MAG: hypothetical protein LBI53_02110 [Candidatus Peribacteria bacterium]|jgi:hypothetical protein|nr:hypothetical protein [Candidatus Peribacteria bacterium]